MPTPPCEIPRAAATIHCFCYIQIHPIKIDTSYSWVHGFKPTCWSRDFFTPTKTRTLWTFRVASSIQTVSHAKYLVKDGLPVNLSFIMQN